METASSEVIKYLVARRKKVRCTDFIEQDSITLIQNVIEAFVACQVFEA